METIYCGIDQLKAAGKEKHGNSDRCKGFELGMAVRVLLVRRARGHRDAHETNDIGGAVE